MKKLLALIAEHLVDYPDQVKVNERHGEQTLVLELSVAKQDIGRVLGKKGKNVQAIRTVINAASVKLNQRTIVEISE